MYLIVILSFLINPLAANGAQWEHNACAEMQQMAEPHHSPHYSPKHANHHSEHHTEHECCEEEMAHMANQPSSPMHNCDTCSECQTQLHSNGCLFSASLFSEASFRQQEYLSIRPIGYPTPIQERVIPPIA